MCQVHGILSRDRRTVSWNCHRPNSPMALLIGSSLVVTGDDGGFSLDGVAVELDTVSAPILSEDILREKYRVRN